MKNDYHHLRPGLVKKIDYSINLLRKFVPLALRYDPTDGFFLAFSGGKDSQALYHVAQLAGVPFKAHFSPTSVDPPQLIRFIRTQYKDVQWQKLKRSIYQVAVDKNILPTMKVRWCCQEFKENAGAGKVTLIGVRHEESARRAKRNEVEVSNRTFSGNYDTFMQWSEEQIKKKYKNVNHDQFSIDKEHEVKCINGKDSILVSPIIDWTARDVWDFLNGMEIPHCELYDMGYTRIGCILCPMSSRKSKIRDMQLFPHVKEKWIKAIMEIRKGRVQQGQYNSGVWSQSTTKRRDGLQCLNLSNNQLWGVDNEERLISERIFDWWISGKAYSEWYADTILQNKINFEDDEN